jgi:hypothetical protein
MISAQGAKAVAASETEITTKVKAALIAEAGQSTGECSVGQVRSKS